ncbi:MAG: response regulator [Christensenellaceae bacterium]|jgi:two-component system sensor histidine kinase/response regulator
MAFSSFRPKSAMGIGAIASDVTEERKMQRELIEAKKQADASNRAKSDFLSRMSHEMRTPMNAIIGMTNMARSAEDVERKDYCLGKIDEASTHLLGVINDILDMSKIEANKFTLSCIEFSFEQMISKVSNIISFRVEEKDLRFSVELADDIPYSIITDEQRLAQVITNLLSNAVKFTPEGGVVGLKASKISEKADELILQIEVSDSGIGISKEQQKRLFRSFEQADGGISRKFGGTGLGLVISKNIIRLMGGKIWVESELGEGSRFIFTFEAKRGSEARPALPALDWKNMQILAVDDEAATHAFFKKLSDAAGFTCRTAANGNEALRMVNQSKPYDIVFVDGHIPGMDGLEFARQVKSRAAQSRVVFMATALERAKLETGAKEAGADGYISKPLFSFQVIDAITNQMASKAVVLPEAGAEENTAEPSRHVKKHVLLAEDIEINREIVLAMLEDTGLIVECAENGVQAVEMFDAFPDRYDIVFMDIHMPDMDGYEATRKIRAMPYEWAKKVPIVAMTANVFKEDVERCLAAGMNDHIGKPIDMDVFFTKLDYYLDMGRDGEK